MSSPAQHIILLALGKFSTQYYYQQLSQFDAGFNIQLVKVDFEAINTLLPDNVLALQPILEHLFLDLHSDFNSKIVIPNITLHLVIDKIETLKKWRSCIVHPIYTSVDYLKLKGIKQATVIGSSYTMCSTFFKSYFEKNNIQISQPTDADVKTIDEYRKHIYNFGVNSAIQMEFNKLLDKYPSPIIACTELTLINSYNSAFIDLANLQIKHALTA